MTQKLTSRLAQNIYIALASGLLAFHLDIGFALANSGHKFLAAGQFVYGMVFAWNAYKILKDGLP